jgi:hypothetical protein
MGFIADDPLSMGKEQIMTQKNSQQDWDQMTSAEQNAVYEQLRNMPGGPDLELIRQHVEAGVSMYGTDPRYPDKLVELAPDGRSFIVHFEGERIVRDQEIEPRWDILALLGKGKS